MATLNIGKEFSIDPVGRYYSDSDASGEKFREEILRKKINALSENEKLTIILDDGVEAYGSSFLTEGFAGMVKYGYITSQELLGKIDIQFSDEDFFFYKEKVIQYIKEAKYNSEEYQSTK